MIAVLLMTDGRGHLLERTVRAFEAHTAAAPVSERWVHDDSGDPEYARWLREHLPEWRIVSTPGRSGFGGAVRNAWEQLRRASRAPFVFHLEDDFVLTRPVDLTRMAWVLDRHPHVVQLALRRQPWNDHERAAGGIVEQHPDSYAEVVDEHTASVWLEHRLFFTPNPSLYRRTLLLDTDWPSGRQSEGRYSHQLLGDESLRFAFWGSRESGEWCEHIGTERVGLGY